jgi:hypothetical protein
LVLLSQPVSVLGFQMCTHHGFLIGGKYSKLEVEMRIVLIYSILLREEGGIKQYFI